MPFEIEKSSVMAANAPRAIGHREQMQFIDAVRDQGAPSTGNKQALKLTNGILITSKGWMKKKKLYLTMEWLT